MATNTYYSPFFPATEVVGTKGTTIAVVPSAVVGGVQDEIDKINDKLENIGEGGTVDNTPPGAVTNLVVSSNLTDTDADLLITWTPPSDDDLAGFDVAVAEGNGTFIRFTTSGFNYKISRVRRNQLYKVQVRAFDRVANPGPWTSIVEHTTARDTVPPADVTNINAETAYETAFLSWNNPADADLVRVDVHLFDTSNVNIKAVSVAATPTGTGTVSFTKIPKATNYYVIIYSVDSSGNASNGIRSANFATAGGIDLNDFTPGLTPITTVTSLPPLAGYTGTPTLMYQGRLYTAKDGQWVAANDIDPGQIVTEDLADDAVTVKKFAAKMGGANLLRNSGFGLDRATSVAGGKGPTPDNWQLYDNSGGNQTTSINIVAGGRTNNFFTASYSANTNQKGIIGVGKNSLLMQPSTTYVLSWYARGSGSAAGAGMTVHWNYAPTTQIALLNPNLINNEWRRFAYRITTSTTPDPNFYISVLGMGGAGVLDICDIQLEEGEVLTPYKLALFEGEVTANMIAANSVQAVHIKAKEITADKVALGTLTAAQIAAGTITANVLAIGDSSNLVRDSTVTSYDCWGKGVGSPAYIIVPGGGQYAGNYILIPYAPGEQQVGSLPMPVTQGEQYYASGILDNTSNAGAGARLHITWYSDTSGTAYISDSVIGINYNGWTGPRTSATVTAPTNAKTARLIFTRLAGGSTNSNFAEPIFKAVLGGTLIKNGAIQTNHITVGTLNGDRISAGTIDADRIKANSVLAGSIQVGGTSLDSIKDSAGASAVTGWVPNGVFTQAGNKLSKTGGSNAVWDWNIYTANAFKNGCMIKGRLATTSVFLGLTVGNPGGTYGVMNYSWHRSNDGTVSVWTGGDRLALWDAATLAADTIDFSIVYDGKTVRWFSNDVERYSVVAAADLTLFGAMTAAYFGNYIDRISFTPAQDNSLNRADPAARINQATTAIDPGKILVSGGTYLRDWRQGGDETKIAGGSVSANTIDANKLKIGNRGLSFLGIDFQYNPTQGWVEWTEGYIYYVDNNNNPVGEYIAPGNTGASAPHLFLYWFPGTGRVNFNQNNPASNDSVMLASWWGGSRITANYGGTIINGDRIVTNTINANRIVAASITADKIAGTTITGDKIAAGTITTDKLNVGPASGARMSLEYNTIKVYDASTKRVQLGNLDL